MAFGDILDWPLLKQIRRGDATALGDTVASERSRELEARTKKADDVVASVCPYCAVGCGQLVYLEKKDGRKKITDIEGDPDSPVSRGRLCPKGAATFQLVTSSDRQTRVLHRKPFAKAWEAIPLETAMQMVAERVKKTREETWQEQDEKDHVVHRTLGIAHLGGATLDNEENYLLKKLFTALGVVQVENQARI